MIGGLVQTFLKERIPDKNMIRNFRYLLQENKLAEGIFKAVNAQLARKGLLLRRGSIPDVSLVAPSSAKNAEGERDPEMHQTQKVNDWYFGL